MVPAGAATTDRLPVAGTDAGEVARRDDRTAGRLDTAGAARDRRPMGRSAANDRWDRRTHADRRARDPGDPCDRVVPPGGRLVGGLAGRMSAVQRHGCHLRAAATIGPAATIPAQAPCGPAAPSLLGRPGCPGHMVAMADGRTAALHAAESRQGVGRRGVGRSDMGSMAASPTGGHRAAEVRPRGHLAQDARNGPASGGAGRHLQ